MYACLRSWHALAAAVLLAPVIFQSSDVRAEYVFLAFTFACVLVPVSVLGARTFLKADALLDCKVPVGSVWAVWSQVTAHTVVSRGFTVRQARCNVYQAASVKPLVGLAIRVWLVGPARSRLKWGRGIHVQTLKASFSLEG